MSDPMYSGAGAAPAMSPNFGAPVELPMRFVDAMEQRLREHGIDYKRKVIPDRQIHQLFFHDPDGHMIELGRYGVIDQ